MKTVLDIIAEYLKKNGYDGLCGDECSCGIDEFSICRSASFVSCVPGYKNVCDCGGNCFYHITPQKPNNHPTDSMNSQPENREETS